MLAPRAPRPWNGTLDIVRRAAPLDAPREEEAVGEPEPEPEPLGDVALAEEPEAVLVPLPLPLAGGVPPGLTSNC